MMKVLVTTPGGKVGHEVAKLLSKQGVAVRIAAHTVEKAKAEFPGAEVVGFDYANEATFDAALKGVTHLYLAAPGDQAAEPEKRLVDHAKRAGVKRIVKLSAMGVEGFDAAPLRQVEKHLEQSGLEWTILRPTWFMQNFSTSMAGSVREGTLADPSDNGKTAFIDTRDVAAVAVTALTRDGHAGRAYTLTGPEILSREDVAARFSSVLGKPVKYLAITDPQFREAMKPYLSPAYVELLSSLYANIRAGGTNKKTDEVQRLLGRAPIGFEQFIRDHRGVWA